MLKLTIYSSIIAKFCHNCSISLEAHLLKFCRFNGILHTTPRDRTEETGPRKREMTSAIILKLCKIRLTNNMPIICQQSMALVTEFPLGMMTVLTGVHKFPGDHMRVIHMVMIQTNKCGSVTLTSVSFAQNAVTWR
jgi:hypothetical protein